MSTLSYVTTTLYTLLLTLSLSSPLLSIPPEKHLAITQFVEHVAADAVREGLLKELEKRGYSLGKNLIIDFENAQGSVATANQIARKFLGLKPTVIVAITTPSAQAMVKVITKEGLPIVFSAVTDPIDAGLVSSLTDHKSHVTGISDAPPIREQIAFIKTLLPTAKTIGVLYNPGDPGSITSLKTVREQAKTHGLTLVEGTPLKSSDIQTAVLHLVGKVDALYVPLDNMLVSAMATVATLATKHKLPLFTADSGSVEDGALACLGYSYTAVGTRTGTMIADILDGQNPATLPVASPEKKDIFVNRTTAQKLGITLPTDIQKKAHFY